MCMRLKHWDNGKVHRDFPQFCVEIVVVSPVSVSTRTICTVYVYKRHTLEYRNDRNKMNMVIGLC
jgi:hypothetical protein